MFRFLSSWNFTALYVLIIISFIYMLNRYKKNTVDIYFVLLFFPGLFDAMSSAILNVYKVGLLVFTLYVFVKENGVNRMLGSNYMYLFSIIVLSIALFFSYQVAEYNTFTLFFSQNSRYLEYFCIFYILKEQIYVKNRKQDLLKLFYDLYFLQILLAIAKLIIFRRPTEDTVGTFIYRGGSYGTCSPLIGFIVLWLYTDGVFKTKDWLYAIGLLLIGIVTAKRAVIMIFPIEVLAFMVFVKGIKITKTIWTAFLFIPLLFYVGVRFDPTLNPDRKRWGRFDLDYLLNYSEKYQFGNEEHLELVKEIDKIGKRVTISGGKATQNYVLVEGRSGATRAVIDRFFNGVDLTDNDMFGYGYGLYHANMNDEYSYSNVDIPIKPTHKGSSSGLFQSYLAIGYYGAIALIFFFFIPFIYFKKWRMGMIIAVICAWEYFMYAGIIFRTPPFMTIIFFALHYTNYELELKRAQRRLYNESLSYNPGI